MGLNSHLSIRDYTLIPVRRTHILHMNRSFIEWIKIYNGRRKLHNKPLKQYNLYVVYWYKLSKLTPPPHTHPSTRAPAEGVTNFTLLVERSIVEREDKYCMFTIWLIWSRPSTRTLPRGVIKFSILVVHFFGHNYYTLSLADLYLGVEKRYFKEKIHFYYKTYMATS